MDKQFKISSKVMIVCLFVLLIMTGCQSTPEKVKQNMNKYGDNKYENGITLNYCDVDKLKETDMSDCVSRDDNIEYPKSINFSKISTVETGTFRFVSDYVENAEYYNELFKMPDVNGESFSGKLKGDTGVTYEDKVNKKYLYIGNGGTISYVNQGFYDGSYECDMSQKIEKIYIDRGESTDRVLNLNGEKVNLDDELNYALKSSKEFIPDDSFNSHVRTVFIRKDTKGNDLVSMNVVFDYKGVVLDFFGGHISVNEEFDSTVNEMDNFINVAFAKKNDIGFMNVNGILNVEKSEPVNKVIDFSTVVKIFENKMATFNKLRVLEIEPVYMLKPVYNSADGEYYAAGGNEVKFTPVYSFLIQCKCQDDNSAAGVLEANDVAYVNVNMITGEVTTDMGEKNFATKKEK